MTLNRRPRLLPLLLLMMSVPLAVGTTDARAALSEEEGHEEQGHEGGHHRNHVALFLGITHEGEENGFTVGIDYERRITARIGVGAIFDYASGDFRTTVLGAAAFYRARGMHEIGRQPYEPQIFGDREVVLLAKTATDHAP